MSLADQFVAGREAWLYRDQPEGTVDLSREILEYAEHRGTTFEGIDFRGATLADCLFVDCSFVNCRFQFVAFIRCSLLGVRFENCEFEITSLVSSDVSNVVVDSGTGGSLGLRSCLSPTAVLISSSIESVKIKDCSDVDLAVLAGAVKRLELTHSTLSDVTVKDSHAIEVALSNSVGSLTVENSVVRSLDLVSRTGEEVKLVFRASEIRKPSWSRVDGQSEVEHMGRRFKERSVSPRALGTAHQETWIRLHLVESLLSGADLRHVDLSNSTFSSSSLADATWPSAVDRTTPMGRFIPPHNLIVDSIDDVAGVPHLERQQIRRSQVLQAQYYASRRSLARRFLFRFVGITTGHGAHVWRLAVAALLFTALQAVVGGFWKVRDKLRQAVESRDTRAFVDALEMGVSDVAGDTAGYLSVLVTLENRTDADLPTALVAVSTVAGLLIIGLVVGLVSERLTAR